MRRTTPVFLTLVLAAALPAAAVSKAPSNVDPPITSWQPPATYTVPQAAGRTALAEIGGGPVPFFPITPCRQYDSRNTSSLPDNTSRTILLSGAPCGIPSTTNAVAVNITVFNIVSNPGNAVFKVGTASPPTTAWINYGPTETQRANAGVVAVSSGNLVVQVNQGAGSVDFVVDVFGYYYNGNVDLMPTGDYFGIRGNVAGAGLLFGINVQATAPNSYGVRGMVSSTGAGSAGVEGEALAATGSVYGVMGTSNTVSDSAGVFGRSGAALTGVSGLVPAGIRGESLGGIGVWGVSTYIGAGGRQVDTLGGLVSVGYVGYAGYALYGIGNSTVTGSKSFVDPHPTDARKVIKYVSLEGPESGTYFRGRAQFIGRTAVIPVPEDFRLVSDDEGLTVQVTPIGAPASVWVARMDLNEIVVQSTRDVEFSYIVHGVRKAFRDFQPIQENLEFVPESADARMALALSSEQKRSLIANGTYNPDGTVNMQTAERLGWAQKWREETARSRAVTEEPAAATSKP